MPSETDVSDTCLAKSDQLNSDDLVGGPITVKIAGVKRGPEDQPVWVSIGLKQADGKDKPWKPCKSMRRALVFAWGKDSTQWVGRSLCLMRDPNVIFAGQLVGGIRIQAMSHIAARLELSLAVSKGKKAKVVIERIGDGPAKSPAAEPSLVEKYAKRISELHTEEIAEARKKFDQAASTMPADTAAKITALFDARIPKPPPNDETVKSWLVPLGTCQNKGDVIKLHDEFDQSRGSMSASEIEAIEAAFAARMGESR